MAPPVLSPVFVSKFGGTSVKDAPIITSVVRIVHSDLRRRFIVVSAPAGVTNQLIKWLNASEEDKVLVWSDLVARFETIARELNVNVPVRELFDTAAKRMEELKGFTDRLWLTHYVRSLGEWVNAQIVAAALGFKFLDARDLIVFLRNGRFSLARTRARAKALGLRDMANDGVVIPGFYGAVTGHREWTMTFSRGGSDITGAIVAVLVGAKVYENWTDVEGILAADPRVVTSPRKNEIMTYRELRELSFMGAKVFHEDAVAIVRNAKIPIHVRCTMNPSGTGTLITTELPDGKRPIVTGIAGKNGFSIITMDKFGMDDVRGILARAARVFSRAGVNINVSSSIDSMTFIVATAEFTPVRGEILDVLRSRFKPDDLRVEDDIALICTVGEGMRDRVGVSARLDMANARSGVNIILELQGGSQINIMRGVKASQATIAINAAYDELCREHQEAA